MTTLFSAGTQRANTARDNLLSSRFVFSWKLIEESVLTGSVASVTFSSIPGIYRTLAMTLQARTDRAFTDDNILWRANADAGNNYDRIVSLTDGAGGTAFTGVLATAAAWAVRAEGANSTASNFAPGLCFWLGYALTDRQKYSLTPSTFDIGDLSALALLQLASFGGHWRNTAAITSLTLLPAIGANLVSGSRLALYGVL